MLNWYTKAFFVISVLIALAMSWYSMTDLATAYYQVPLWLAVLISLAFDVGALFLGLVSVEYAKTNDSGFLAEAGTFLFVLASIYINVSHAQVAAYGLPGMIMFGSAPVIAGIALKVYLNFITRQARHESGRIVQRVPVAGKLTWLIYPKQSFSLLKVAMRHRLMSAADTLSLTEDKHGLFERKTIEQAPIKAQASLPDMPSKAPESLPETSDNSRKALPRTPENVLQTIPHRSEADIDEIVHSVESVSLPAWLPDEPTMSVTKIAKKCVENGETSIPKVLQYATQIKGSPVNYSTVQKAVHRARGEAEGIL
jgi:hypothetical protein